MHSLDTITKNKVGILNVLVGLITLTMAIRILIAFWATDKGFELGDEGYYMMSYHYWYKYSLYDYFRFCGKYLNSAEWTIVNTRILKIILECSSVFILSYAFIVYLTKVYKIPWSKSHRTLFLVLLFQGLFLSLDPRSASYNDFCVLLNFISFSAILLIMSQRCSFRASIGLLLLSGTFGGLLFPIKFPSALMQPFIIGLLLAITTKDIGRTVKLFACYFVPYTFVVNLYIIDFGGWSLWIAHFQEMVYVGQFVGYRVEEQLKNYVLLGAYITIPIFICIIPWIYFVYKRGVGALTTPLGIALLMIPFLAPIIMIEFNDDFTTFNTSMFWYTILAITALLYASVFCLFFAKQKIPYSLIAFAFLVPATIIFGSNTPFNEALMGCNTSIVALLFSLLLLVFIKVNKAIAMLLGAIAFLTLNIHFFSIYLFYPYGLENSLFNQNVTYIFRREKLKLSAETAEFMHTSKHLLTKNGFQEEDPIIALDMLSGLVYLVNGYSPVNSWYPIRTADSHMYACYFLEQYLKQNERGKMPWIVYCYDPTSEQIKCMKSSVFNFPDSYVLIDSVYTPYSKSPDFMFGAPIGSYHIKFFKPAQQQ